MIGRCLKIVLIGFAATASQAIAEEKPMIELRGFECFVEHFDIYETQGQIIVVNFSTCPEPPSNKDRIEAGGYTASTPTPRIDGYYETRLLRLSLAQAKCLRENAEEIALLDRYDDKVAIEPMPCGQDIE